MNKEKELVNGTILKEVKLSDGKIIKDISDECDYDTFTPEEKIQHMMMKITEAVYNFIVDIANDLDAAEDFVVKISGDGTYYSIELCNVITRVIIGRLWTYNEVLVTMTKPKEFEYGMNEFVRTVIAKSNSLEAREETYFI